MHYSRWANVSTQWVPEDGRRRRSQPKGDGVMTWMRTAMAGPRWRLKIAPTWNDIGDLSRAV